MGASLLALAKSIYIILLLTVKLSQWEMQFEK